MRPIEIAVERIFNRLYKNYGSDTGILFGIPSSQKQVVKSIIKLAIEADRQSPIEVPLSNIDFDLLKKQKRWLLDQKGEEAQGLLNFIDHVQDMFVDNYGKDENIVFDLQKDDEE